MQSGSSQAIERKLPTTTGKYNTLMYLLNCSFQLGLPSPTGNFGMVALKSGRQGLSGEWLISFQGPEGQSLRGMESWNSEVKSCEWSS